MFIINIKGRALKLPMDTVLSILNYIGIEDDKILEYYQKLIEQKENIKTYTIL